MPYPNMPKHLWGKMEDCVRDVKAKGGVKNAYAVCYNSIMGKHKKSESDSNRKALMRVKKKK